MARDRDSLWVTTIRVVCRRSIEILHQALYLFSRVRIEVSRGLVRQKHIRIHDQGPRDGYSLLLTAGQFARPVVTLSGQAHVIEQSPSARFRERCFLVLRR